MTARKASDFVVGEYVKVVGPFASRYAYLRGFIGWYGRVLPFEYRTRLVRVGFLSGDFGRHFPPKALERGRLVWEPEDLP